MTARSRSVFVVVTTGLALAAGVALLAWRATPAHAQGLASAPACQCSAATAIPGLSTSLVHCICGGMTCVLSQHAGQGGAENLLQCVR